jgi:hypothetical protein
MRYTCKDWVLVLLDSLNEDMKAKVMFLWWRAWHHRNDCIFGKGDASISHSAVFVKNYHDSVELIKNGGAEVDRKGKKPVMYTTAAQKKTVKEDQLGSWEKPDVGWTKVNVDASFSIEQSSGSWGAVARDHDGRVIASAWGIIEHCRSAQVCEAIFCYEDPKLTINDTSNRIIIETDCQSLLSIFKPDSEDRSDARFIAEDFNRLIAEGKIVILSYKNRNDNNLAHEIAKFASRELCSGLLHGQVPSCVSELAMRECKNVFSS